MEEKNELSDILLEQKSSNNSTKIKRLIVIAVLLILLFILVIMIMKFINKSDDTSSTLTDPMLVQTPPDNMIDETPIDASDFDLLDENMTFTENLTTEYNVTSNDSGITVLENESVNVSPNVVEQPVIATPPPVTAQSTKPKTVVPKSDTKPALPASSSVSSGHYVQIGAFAGTPDKNFLDKITKTGYKYQSQKTNVGAKAVTKVLIGPYNSRSEADKELPNIRSVLVKDAFYIRIQ